MPRCKKNFIAVRNRSCFKTDGRRRCSFVVAGDKADVLYIANK
jgi:hypothetical protein